MQESINKTWSNEPTYFVIHILADNITLYIHKIIRWLNRVYTLYNFIWINGPKRLINFDKTIKNISTIIDSRCGIFGDSANYKGSQDHRFKSEDKTSLIQLTYFDQGLKKKQYIFMVIELDPRWKSMLIHVTSFSKKKKNL